MSIQLPDSVWSPEDVAELIADMQRYEQWLSSYDVKRRVNPELPMSGQPNVSAVTVACLQVLHDHNTLNQAGVEELITELQAVQNQAPRIAFTFAAPASNGLKKQIVAWCRKHVAPNTLVSFQFNATILGGMVVRYGSHIFDWSFKRGILANRSKFAEILRNV